MVEDLDQVNTFARNRGEAIVLCLTISCDICTALRHLAAKHVFYLKGVIALGKIELHRKLVVGNRVRIYLNPSIINIFKSFDQTN